MEVFLPDFLNTLFGWILSLLGRSKIKAEHQTRYEELRYKTAEALTMYANCLSNPINIEVSCLPDSYKEGSNELRRIASGFDALSKVLPKNAKGIPTHQTPVISKNNDAFVSPPLLKTPTIFTKLNILKGK